MPRYRSHETADLPPRMHRKHGAYYLVVQKEGKRKWVRLSRNYSKALIKYRAFEQGQPVGGRRFIDLHMTYLRHDFYLDLADATKDRYEYAFQKIVPVFRDLDVAEITTGDVYQYLQHRSAVRSAANTEHGILIKHFELARLLDWRSDNPAAGVPWFSQKKRERILTPVEFSAIYLSANQPVQLAMDISYMLGLRIGDVLSMTWGQVDEGGVFAHQAKNQVKGYYPMTDDLLRALEQAGRLHGRSVVRHDGLHVIHNRKMQPYTYYGFRSMFRRAVQQAGVPDVRFHDIRRTAITQAAKDRGNPQEFSLHKSARQAQDYVVSVPKVIPLKKM